MKFYVNNPETDIRLINKIVDKIHELKTLRFEYTLDIVNPNGARLNDRLLGLLYSNDNFNIVRKTDSTVELLSFDPNSLRVPVRTDFKYNTEIVLLTKTYYECDLEAWIRYHLNVIGINHIVVLDNQSPVDVKSLCSKYPQVEYHLIVGWADQYKQYDKYVNESKARYCIPIDDDEYIYVSKKFGHKLINVAKHYLTNGICKLSIEWLNLFPGTYTKSRTEAIPMVATSYCHEAVKHWQLGDTQVKTLVDTRYRYEYIGAKRGHNPKCINGPTESALTIKGYTIPSQTMKLPSEPTDDVLIVHYQFRSEEEWNRKCKLGSPGSKWFGKIKNKATIEVLKKIYSYEKYFKTFNFIKEKLNELDRK